MKISPITTAQNIKKMIVRDDICTIDPFSVKTESQILDLCGVNGILDEVFGEKSYLTIR